MVKKVLRKMLSDETVVKLKHFLYRKNNRKMLSKYRKTVAVHHGMEGGLKKGINLIGDIQAETGLGQSMRILAGMLRKNGIPFCIIHRNAPGLLEHNEHSFDAQLSECPVYGINLIHVNPGEWAEFYNSMPESLFAGRYNIAFWLWELENFPGEWEPCAQTVDEIWTPSEFISQSIRKITDKPVFTIPYEINLLSNGTNRFARDYFNLPEREFLFLLMYDFKSVSERKNPAAAIKAYKKAFPAERDKVGLVIKINHLDNSRQLDWIRNQLAGYNNVYILTDNMSRLEVESLIMESDALISLHRSEGFGLPMAEAMYGGTPVIATNWSANVEFMDDSCACLVDCTMKRIEKTVGPYAKGNRWAEADIDMASVFMQRLVSDSDYYRKLKQNGKLKISKVNEKANELLRRRAATVIEGYSH